MDYAFDPELQPRSCRFFLALISATSRRCATCLLQLRAAVPQLPPPESVSVRRQVVPGPAGGPDVEVRIVTPDQPAPRPALLWMHGGGFVMGDVDGDLGTVMNIAAEVGVVMVSVSYRLAPEHPTRPGSRTASPR